MHYFLSTIVIALLSSPVSTTSCSAFDVSNEPYTQPALRTSIISQGLTCNSKSGDCRVPIGGYVTDRRTLNVTISAADAVFQRISDTVGFPFNDTVTTWVGASVVNSQQTWPLQNNTSGYIGFTPNHRCTSGRLSGCDDSTLEDTYVEACTPYSIADAQLSGSIAAIATDRSVAEGMTCNPANTSAAQNGEFSNSCSTTGSPPEKNTASGLGAASLGLLFCTLFVAALAT
jgi:hypothetical protein